jgi:undecaprenyl-diphosphatase
MIEELIKYDTDLFLFLNNLGSEPWDNLWRVITNKLTFIPLYVFLLFLVYKNYGLKGTLIILVGAALMITTSDQLANLFKNGFQRLRPWAHEDLDGLMRMVVDKRGVYSFFSGHAINSMGLAVYMGLLLRHKYYYLPFILLLWAFLVGYSRIYVGVLWKCYWMGILQITINCSENVVISVFSKSLDF